MTCSKGYYATAMEECTNTNGHFATAEQFYANFSQQADAEEIRHANYEKNKIIIDRDADYILTTWNTGVYFNSGFFTGEAQGLLEGYPDLSESISE